MTQTERVQQYMQDFGSITQLDAIRDLGVMRLASRINDMKRQGAASEGVQEMDNAELINSLKDAEKYICYVAPSCYASCEAIKAIRAGAAALEVAGKRIAELEQSNKMLKNTIDADKGVMLDRIRFLEAQLPKEGEWIMDENPHDGDCRCSACLIAIDAMHERNHGLLNALTGGKWWTFYRYCPSCGARMKGEEK